MPRSIVITLVSVFALLSSCDLKKMAKEGEEIRKARDAEQAAEDIRINKLRSRFENVTWYNIHLQISGD